MSGKTHTPTAFHRPSFIEEAKGVMGVVVSGSSSPLVCYPAGSRGEVPVKMAPLCFRKLGRKGATFGRPCGGKKGGWLGRAKRKFSLFLERGV